jgi:soluble lytic murein transglycosylase
MSVQTAQATTILQALRAHDWREAAAQAPDGLAQKLVTFIRMLQPGRAGSAEIDRFITDNPTWPAQNTLSRRLDEALVSEPDAAAVTRICAARAIQSAPALLRCAAVAGHAGGAAYARQAWVLGITDIPAQTDFLRRWADVLTPAEDWRRFDRLAWIDDEAALSQAGRLDGQHALAAQARLALRHDDKHALTLLNRVAVPLRGEPTMVLEEARYLRRGQDFSAAVALWHAAGLAAERTVPSARRGAFWAERDALARRLLAEKNTADAAEIADDPAAPPDQTLDSLFLSGWIALRRNHDAALAVTKFKALTVAARAAIWQGRAHYWLARAAETLGYQARATAEYQAAAAFPTSFYGQLAARALNKAPVLPPDPGWTSQQEAMFARAELPSAAAILAAWGDTPRARTFLVASVQNSTDPATFALAAHAAEALGLSQTQVQIARLAGRQGIMLPHIGWPQPVHVPVGSAPLVLGVMRQESSFDPGAVSPAGAIGLMQILPGTALGISRHAGPLDLLDVSTNTRVGTAYLNAMLALFGGALPEALAAYNAGPHRAMLWQTENGDPQSAAEMIDWIETIPFGETRSYVQRVIESATVYAIKSGIGFDPFARKKS